VYDFLQFLVPLCGVALRAIVRHGSTPGSSDTLAQDALSTCPSRREEFTFTCARLFTQRQRVSYSNANTTFRDRSNRSGGPTFLLRSK